MEQTAALSAGAECVPANRQLGEAASRVIIQWFQRGTEITAVLRSCEPITCTTELDSWHSTKR